MNAASDHHGIIGKHLKQAAKQVPTQELDHFPPLLMYRCLSMGTEALAATSWAAIQTGRTHANELITMPRHSFGPRPVSLLSPSVRTAYAALVAKLEGSLATPSRQRGNWADHHLFGQEGRHSHLVDLDFAACYEFIDHRDLCDELILRSMDLETVAMLAALLGASSARSRGLPQMLTASDRLADTYLAMIDRHLGRQGYDVHRYVDDFRILAGSWNEANQIIEDAAEVARSLGLTLSSEKTMIRRRQTVVDSESAARLFLDSYLERAGLEDDLDGRMDPYDGSDDDENHGDTEVDERTGSAFAEVVSDWHDAFKQAESGRPDYPPGMIANLVAALRGSAVASARLSDEVLTDLVFDDPLRLEAVCRYLEERSTAQRSVGAPEDDEHWESLARLTEMGRQSPWAKLWLLNSASNLLTDTDAEPSEDVVDWVDQQAESSLETVRSEAAWVIARQSKLHPDLVGDLYSRATDVTTPAIAAAVALQGNLPKKLTDAIRQDSPLNEAASAWGED